MVRSLAEKYGRLPSEILKQTPAEFYLNLVVSFPETVTRPRRHRWREAEEKKLGYNPIKKWIEQMKEAVKGHG